MLNPEIVKAVAVTMELTGATFSDEAAEALVEHLSRFETPHVLAALGRCRTELARPFTLADVLDRLPDGRPGPEEAWGMVVGITDQDTVVWTTEIAEAWAAARFLLDEPVQARMAFLEVYRQRIAMARAHGRGPQWQIYLGYDEARRASAIFAGLQAGRIDVAHAKAALPPHEWPGEWRADRALPEGEPVRRADVAALVLNLSADLAADRAPILPEPEDGTLRKALEDQWRAP